jgi:ParB-like chromosome segregation protein Spo0J
MTTLRLDRITQDKSIQQRIGGLQAARVREYSKAMQTTDTFPPITVFHDQGQNTYWLADGFHRCAAAAAAGFTEIEAEVIAGTYRHALLHAAGANAAHGIRRTNADKRKAVLTLLTDDEWSQWSDHEIAKRTHTTQPFVSKLRRLTRTGTVRLGADGRLIETAKIGKSRLNTLGNAWKKTSDEERSQWVAAHRQELQALLRRTEKRKSKINH